MALIEISDISEMLAQRIHSLCKELLPLGIQEGHEWRVGSVAGDAGRSMGVNLKGAKAGVWSDFSSGECGDALELVAAVLFRGDKGDAVKWSRSWLGLDTMDPARLEQSRREAKDAADKRDQKAKEDAKRTQGAARKLWLGGQAELLQTPVYHYLLNRAIDLNGLPKVPGSLRFVPDCWCEEVKNKLPAMCALIQTCEAGHISTHRTYLGRQEDGTWTKAPLKEQKKTLGQFRGGFITLNRGASGKPIKSAPAGDHLFIAEGIETGLSLASELPEKRVIAAVSVSNFQNLVLPPEISTITIAADNDGDNKQTAAAIQKAAHRFDAEGRKVFIIHSSIGKDFNDMLQWQKRALIQNARSAP